MLSLKVLLHWCPLEFGGFSLTQGLGLAQEQTDSFSPGWEEIVNSIDFGTPRSSY